MAQTPVLEVNIHLPLHFCLVGGDARQLYLADALRADRHRVTLCHLPGAPLFAEHLSGADCVLLPMPLIGADGALFAPLMQTLLSLSTVLDALHPGRRIFAGKVSSAAHSLAAERGLVIHDYLLQEELAIANAVPTAEGALQLAMEHLPGVIHKSRVLVAGFGRVGQCTALRFQALGARVSVLARNPAQLALADTMGCTPIPLPAFSRDPSDWDLVINTVPSPIFNRERLEQLGSALLLELASPPGGFDRQSAKELELTLVDAPGLPGKVAPAAAARAIQSCIYHMLEESKF